MVRHALDDDRILGGIIAMLLLSGVALVVGFVSWTANAERPSLAVVEQVESVEASPTPSPRGPVDEDHADAPRGRASRRSDRLPRRCRAGRAADTSGPRAQ